MESKLCDGNHSDSNVLLPPRKRLLAGFKKRNNYVPVCQSPLNSDKNGVFYGSRMNNFDKNGVFYGSRMNEVDKNGVFYGSRMNEVDKNGPQMDDDRKDGVFKGSRINNFDKNDIFNGNMGDFEKKGVLVEVDKKDGVFNDGWVEDLEKDGDFDGRIRELAKRHLKNPNLSLEEIVEESNRAAADVIQKAKAARARAEEKAVVAAKAMAGAQKALEMVADISEEVYNQDRYLKKNKMKKHLPVEMFYNKNGNVENCNKDEELARRLHHVMNSSRRITRNSMDSSLTIKRKRMKGLSIGEGSRVSSNGLSESESDETDPEDLGGGRRAVGTLENKSKWIANSPSKNIGNGEAGSSHMKEKSMESLHESSNVGRKRARMKQKTLSLSNFSVRDLANTKEETRSSGGVFNVSLEKNNVAPSYVRAGSDSVMPAKPTSMWKKCKAFKAPVCVKQNKVTEP